MKIIIDAMGGDNAPLEIVKGALLGMEHWGVEVLLTGDTEAILRALRDCGHDTIPHGMEIVHTTETVDMCDDPSKVFRHKKDTSMGVGLTLLRDGKADALVSAGSTGALLAGATLITKRIRGIRRAAMAPVIPTTGGRAVLIDCGANAECTPEYLLQFAYLGSFYAGRVLGLERPRVGLLNIGTEDSKGTDLQKAALALLRQYNQEPFHIQHALTVEAVMRWFANDLGYGKEADFWAMCGLLHDIDFEKWPEQHCVKAPELLRPAGVGEEMIHAICSHGHKICTDVAPEKEMEKVLFACDELTGLIGAAALMRPSKSTTDMELSSVKKKFKDKKFAAGCSREVIKDGAELLGWELDTLIQKTLTAMQQSEAGIREELAALLG